MKEINIGRVLIKNRHKRGITQDELATHLGVSKEMCIRDRFPSVSR